MSEKENGGTGETTNNAIGPEENSQMDKEASDESYPGHKVSPKVPSDIWGEKSSVEKGSEDPYLREDRSWWGLCVTSSPYRSKRHLQLSFSRLCMCLR